MGAENQIASSRVRCGGCGGVNMPETRFCEGCGQSLYEPCVKCGLSVLLTQKFCGACGADLAKAVQAKHEQHDRWLADAVAAAKNHQFDTALTSLRRVAELADYRFAEASQNAKQGIEKVTALRQRAMAKVNDSLARAKEALQRGNKLEAVKLLESIPPKLMDQDAKRILTRLKTFTDEVTTLDSEMRSAVESNDWPLVGGLLDQIIQLAPEETQYQKIAKQVSEKLIANAKHFLGKGKYSHAAHQLNAIPPIGRSKEYRKLQDSIDVLYWLSQQFDSEPYATPTLGRLAVRFSKETPHDKSAPLLVKELSTRLKNAPRPAGSPFPLWKADPDSWMGGKVTPLGLSQSIDLGEDPLVKTAAGQFNVAIGLALQGLGRGRVTEQFGPKQGFLSSLKRRKKKACWGIDIGTASLKAVRLEEDDQGRLTIEDCFLEQYEAPLCRGGHEDDAETVLPAVIEKFLEEKEIGDEPLWANVSSSQLTNRFVLLPPIKDKQVLPMLEKEIEQRTPIPKEDLAIVRWVEELADDEVRGRSAVISAAKRLVIEQRLELLREAGLPVTGLQADALALVNYAAHEFSDLWIPPRPEEPEESDDEEQEQDLEQIDRLTAQTVAIVDAGASSTSLILVSGEAHWAWTIEMGGEDLTSLVARATKTTHGDAEKLKRNPSGLPIPSRQYEPVEQRLEKIRQRLEWVYADALKQNPRFEVVQCWCSGGAWLTHQWIQRVLLKRSEEIDSASDAKQSSLSLRESCFLSD